MTARGGGAYGQHGRDLRADITKGETLAAAPVNTVRLAHHGAAAAGQRSRSLPPHVRDEDRVAPPVLLFLAAERHKTRGGPKPPQTPDDIAVNLWRGN